MPNNWNLFLEDYRKKHPKMSLKQAMQEASIEYNSQKTTNKTSSTNTNTKTSANPKTPRKSNSKNTSSLTWNDFVADYSKRHNISYGEALKAARDEYYALKNDANICSTEDTHVKQICSIHTQKNECVKYPDECVWYGKRKGPEKPLCRIRKSQTSKTKQPTKKPLKDDKVKTKSTSNKVNAENAVDVIDEVDEIIEVDEIEQKEPEKAEEQSKKDNDKPQASDECTIL